MLRLLFWLVVLGVVGLMLNGNLPIPGIADEEVVYATPAIVASCGSSGCLAVDAVEVANVGRSAQETVRVRLRTDAFGTPVVPPTVRRAQETSVPTVASERPGVDMYPLGRLAPEERVTLVFALRAASREAVPPWERVLVAVEPAKGVARPGDVDAITVDRVVHSAGRVVQRLVRAVSH